MPKPDLRANPADIVQAVEDAAALYRQGRLDEAEKICTRVLKARSDWFDALHLLGLIKLQGGKAGAAHGHLEAALKRDREALATLDQALALAPDNYEALNNRGNVLLKLNRPAEALAAFERSAALEPRFLGARINRGNTLAQLGRFEEAV